MKFIHILTFFMICVGAQMVRAQIPLAPKQSQRGNPLNDSLINGNRKNNSQQNQREQVAGSLSVSEKTVKTDTLTELESKLFGYMVFHNTNINFTPNLNMATPKSYVIGPGDVLQVQVFGIAQSTYNLPVKNDGNVNIQDIGIVHVGGLTIEAAKSLLQKKLSIRYAGMNGTNPNTFIDLTLDNIRSIKVNIVGEVFRPGTFTLPSYVNVFNALFAAGGPTVKGTFRYVQVYRNNRLAGEIDLYDFLVNGKMAGNIRLEDNDVILVRPSASRVEVAGEIRIPGYFELKKNETFQDLLKFAGGFSSQAYKSLVKVIRKGVNENQVFDIPSADFNKALILDGDSITVDQISGRFNNRVQASGAVFRPGAYQLVKGMTVADIIQKAGGLKGEAFLPKALLYRTRSDYTQEVISLNLTDSTQKSTVLQNEDVLIINSLYDLKEEYYVQISGEVNSTGIYPFSDSLTVSGLIFKAGGFKYSASGSYIEIVRRNFNEAGKVADIITVSINKDLTVDEKNSRIVLKPFDHVFVRNMPGFQIPKIVNIEGEVNYAGSFAIDKKDMRISDLLQRAGGITQYAYTKGATLLRRNKNFKFPSLAVQENIELEKLLYTLEKDSVLSATETYKENAARIRYRIEQNKLIIEKEKELLEQEEAKKQLLRESTSSVASTNVKVEIEKQLDLVAIDLDAIIKAPGSNEDLILKDGDLLSIPERQELVAVKGGVLYPVSIKFDPSLRFNNYIERAGGYSTRAIRKKAYIIQANGKVQRVRSFLFIKSFPKVNPGAEIVVPASLVDKPPFNYVQTVGLVTTFITSTLTLLLLLRNL